MPDATTAQPIQLTRAASFQPSSYDAATNSLEVCWSIGAAGLRFDWLDGRYYTESLSMDPAHVRLGRLNAGGCLIDSHNTGSVRSVLGSVVPGSARIVNGEGIARVRLATTPDVADTNQKIIDGHIRSLSVSYNVFKFERTEAEGEHPLMHAIDWEPLEISMVVVPFDAAATVRAKGTHMPEIIENEADGERQRSTPARQPRGTVTEAYIRERCSRSDDISRSFERSLIEQHAEEPFSRRELERAISEQLIGARALPTIDVRGSFNGHVAANIQQRNAFADVLFARISGGEVPEAAREYAGAGIVDMARALLETHGERVRWARPAAVIDALARSGQHTTSDFAYILNSAGSRYLINAYTASASPLRRLARKRDFPDFRTRFGLQAEGPAVLRNVPENGEFKRVTVNEVANGAKLTTYGEILSISRQALVNDDLGVFLQMALFWARAAAGTEGSFLAALIDGNGIVMGEDGKTLYHADHGNIAAVGSSITISSLGAAREQLRTMKNRDGITPADVVPKFLVVGPKKETEAEQALAAINATTQSEANPFSGRLELVVDSRLTGKSWRLFADPAINPVLEYGNLEGQGGLFTDTRVGFDVDGVDFKARTDIGAGAVDWRGTVMNPGD